MKNIKLFLIFLVAAATISGCSVNKFIPSNKTLLKSYDINYLNKKDKTIDNSEVKAYLRPKPNSGFLGMQYKLYFYYRSKKHPTKLNLWLNKKLGEEPVYTDEVDPERLAKKMQRYLANTGFFDTKINYQIKDNKKKSKIVFNINTGKPYIIDSISYDISDKVIRNFVIDDTASSLIKKGNIYNVYTLDDERERITNILRNSGYYFFNQNYIKYMVDSNNLNHRLRIKTIITNRIVPNPMVLGGSIELPHYCYFINKVEVIPDYNPVKYTNYKPVNHVISHYGDSTYSYTYLIHTPKPRFKLKAFDQSIKIKQGKPYCAADVKATYQRLFAMPIIQTATISFDTLSKSDSLDHKWLNARVQMAIGKLNYYSIEGVVTNSSGDPGVRGNVVVANKNLFRGSELLRVKLNGGFEAQAISSTDSIGSESSSFFNTFEAGVDASIIFPRFVSPIPFRRFSQKYHPTTNLTFGFNYLLRPNYSRNSTNILLGYSWKKNKKIRFITNPAIINYINVNPTPEFQEILDKETNQRLKEQYSDHLIAGNSISMVYDNQKIKSAKSFDYVRLDFETSGNLFYAIQQLTGFSKTDDEYYKVMGIRYSQYIRAMVDYRHYFHFFNPDYVIVYRALAGAGIPYLNSNEIPYEKGFYAGGANDMRGWRFRTLGPGGYSGVGNYERVGDIQLETNLEYRFPIYSFLKGAFFTDIGNIWSYNSDNYPDGQFKVNSFYKQLAVDGGFGVRFDFTYFIFRLDAGIPLRDPSFPESERWRYNYLQWKQFVINFGIGYPF